MDYFKDKKFEQTFPLWTTGLTENHSVVGTAGKGVGLAHTTLGVEGIIAIECMQKDIIINNWRPRRYRSSANVDNIAGYYLWC